MLFDDNKNLEEMFFGETSEDLMNEDADIVSIEESVNEYILSEAFEGLTESEIEEMITDPDFKVIAEAMKLKNKTIMRLSKKDDLERRESMMIVQIAKEKGDPLVKLLAKAIKTKKKIMAKLKQKYGNQGRKRSVIAQKEYIKSSKGINKVKSKIISKRK